MIDNLKLLEKIFTDKDAEYWVVAKRNTSRAYGEWKDDPDSIVLITLPFELAKLRWKENDPSNLSIKEIDRLGGLEITTNIFLSETYAPFQHGQYLHRFYDGFAIKNTNIWDFIDRARALKSHNLYDYEKLMVAETA